MGVPPATAGSIASVDDPASVPTPDLVPDEVSAGRHAGSGEWDLELHQIDRYLLLDRLGVGSFGVVRGAYDPELDRRVAIKLLRLDPTSTSTSTRKPRTHATLLEEARAVAKLSHPNVVAVYDVGRLDDAKLHSGRSAQATPPLTGIYIVMEHLDGLALPDWLAAQTRHWSAIRDVFVDAGRGLAAAHAAGLVHRDFKPGNLRFGAEGRIRVLDFGLADAVAALREADQRLSGTPRFMAPEQLIGAPIDARADQYAFCVSLWQSLWGTSPFPATKLPELTRLKFAGPPTPPTSGSPRLRGAQRTPDPGGPGAGSDVPRFVVDALIRGLAPRPEHRFANLDGLLNALTHDPRRRRRQRLAGLGLGLGLFGAGVALAEAALHPASPSALAPCRPLDAEAALADAWDPALRDAIGDHFARFERPAAREQLERLLPELDAWAGRWRDGWIDACADTRVRGEQSEALLDRRMSCLERQRRRFGAYASLLVDADLELARQALDGLEELGAPEHCADVDALLLAIDRPADPELRGHVDALTAELDRTHAALAAGEWDRAQAQLTQLEPELASVHWRPLDAEFAYLRGALAQGTSALEPGEPAYARAIHEALAVGDERLAAEALQGRALLVGEWGAGRLDDALDDLNLADALAERVEDPALRGTVALAEAKVLEIHGDYPRALAAAVRARESFSTLPEVRARDLALARYREAMMLYRLGRVADAQAMLAAGRHAWGERWGPSHPVSLDLLNGAALLAGEIGDWAEAVALFEDLVARTEASYGPDHLELADALANLAVAQSSAGLNREARRSNERALAIREHELGGDHVFVGHALANLSLVYADLGEHELAEAAASRAEAIILAARGPEHIETLGIHDLRGQLRARAGDHRGARVHYDRAIAVADRIEAPQGFDSRLRACLSDLALADAPAADACLAAARRMRPELASSPVREALFTYVELRHADARGASIAAKTHAAALAEQLATIDADGLAWVREAHAWLDEHGVRPSAGDPAGDPTGGPEASTRTRSADR